MAGQTFRAYSGVLEFMKCAARGKPASGTAAMRSWRSYVVAGMLAVGGAWVASAQLAEAAKVYILPMAGGLDQYLAQRISQERVLTVVTDPKNADVIITDRIGEDFQQTLRMLYEEPTEDAGKAGDDFTRPTMRPLSASRGTVFLVERSSGDVLWSTLEPPKSSEVKDLARAAEVIVERLEKARGGD